MNIKELKEALLDFAPAAVDELKSIIKDKRSSPKIKLDAIQLVFDRIGLPALRASISQTLMSHQLDTGNIIEANTKLLLEAKKVEEELIDVEKKLGKANKNQ